MITMKFGGTSVGSASAIQRVCEIIKSRLPQEPVVITSAVGGITDKLVALTKESATNDAAVREIALAHSVDEVKDIRDKAIALEIYARQALNTDLERKATEIRIRAERKAGQQLKEMERIPPEKRNPGKRVSGDGTPIPSEYATAKKSANISIEKSNLPIKRDAL